MVIVILSCVFALIWGATIVVASVAYKKKGVGNSQDLTKELIESTTKGMLESFANSQNQQFMLLNNTVMQELKNNTASTQSVVSNLSVLQKQEFDIVTKRVDDLTARNEQRIEKLTTDVNASLNNIRQENEKQLDKMRETVDEKLNNSLSQRLNDSFSKIQQSLESVNLGLGEMRSLATGVGDLKKVLTNVKVRGGWGEVMLSQLLEQVLAPSQYEAQVRIKKNSQERVDYVIKMPGKNQDEVLLPIDSKFPLEDYNRLVEVSDGIDKDVIDKAQKQLVKRIKDEAKSIKEKYIDVPSTTDFAIMFLPIEGLYAQVVRDVELVDTLQNQYKVVVCGPTTLVALLNSLQLGFKTLYIEKRSSELWQILSTFKQEFENFVQLLLKTQSKLGEANTTIEQATKSSKKIAKKLGDVSQIVGIDYDDEDDDNSSQGELPNAE